MKKIKMMVVEYVLVAVVGIGMGFAVWFRDWTTALLYAALIVALSAFIPFRIRNDRRDADRAAALARSFERERDRLIRRLRR